MLATSVFLCYNRHEKRKKNNDVSDQRRINMREFLNKAKKYLQKKRRLHNTSTEPTQIMPLSPNDKLFDEENALDFLKYETFLGSAFSNPRVRNIAITGNHGVGKSSIIRSYESKDPKAKKGYLYISLMDFNNTRDAEDLRETDENDRAEDNHKLQREFEHYLLCQILSKVDSQSLPHSTFRLIPKKRRKTAIFLSVCTALITVSVFGILFRSPLEIPDVWLKVLYYVCGSAIALVSLFIAFLIGKRLTSAKISAKYKGIEIETELGKSTDSYIDAHLFEIVYALETLASDIGYTVVLEDMDRLGRSICVDIFSKLRRVNYLVNDRNKLKNKYIRFVYAFDDSVFELTKNTKFFDYVMSVTPKLNYNTAGNYFKDVMISSASHHKTKQEGIRKILETYDAAFWQKAGAVIHDYRTINHIRNEFQLFADIMIGRDRMPTPKWLPFVIYKNVLAEDYCQAFEERGILDLQKQQRNERIATLCFKKGGTYVALVQDLFDYLTDTLRLSASDFQEFTGLPETIVKMRDEVKEQNDLKTFLNKKVTPDEEGIGQHMKEKTILITGGGGAIGSELCRQLATYRIGSLIIVDVSENNAYNIQQELSTRLLPNQLHVEIASVQDKKKMDELFEKYQPNIVFHAAAYKHVPFMENNPEEAIKNNILGTYNLVLAAEAHKVEKFIFISTDKACHPTNMMGVSKRFCELLLRSRKNSNTVFCTVRFGNVLGTNGSVIPLFKRQIENGGPITITDKRIIRYFMTVSEATQLILYSCVMATSPQTFVFDMGQPIRILNLAENMIRLAGLVPYKDIDIVEVGLRPGEKLYEELLLRSESLIKTENKMIFIEQDGHSVDTDRMENILLQIQNAIQRHDDSNVLIHLVTDVVLPYMVNYEIHEDQFASV